MASPMKIVCLFIAFSGVLMKSGNVYEGTVGQTVDIRCPVPDEYTNTPKYFCRDPCASKNVLIQTEKTDQVVSAGRYSVLFHVNAKTFGVTIRHLTLKDSGVYYCGIDKWFGDKQIKVKLSVKVVISAPAFSFSSTDTPKYTVSTRMKTQSSADSSSSPPTVHSTNSKAQIENVEANSAVKMSVVWAGVFMLLVFLALVALVCFNRRSNSKCNDENGKAVQDASNHKQAVEDDGTIILYSLVDPPKRVHSSLIYSTVQYFENSG